MLTDLDGVEMFERFGIVGVGIDHGGADEEREAVERLHTDASRPAGGHLQTQVGRWVAMAERAVPGLVEALRGFEPEVVVREPVGWGALLAGEVCDIPVATYEWTPPPTAVLAASVGPHLDAVRARLGVEADPDGASIDRWLRLVLSPPWWGRGIEHLPATVLWIRPVQPPAPPGARPPWLDSRRDVPLVYATLGTVFNRTEGVFAAMLDGLASLEDIDVIATTGDNVDPATFAGRPDHIHLERFVPQAAVLDHVDAVVAHGGYGTLMGALAAGKPVVTIPLAAIDNVVNATSVAARGAGLVVEDHERTADVIAERTRRVLDEPSFRTAAREAASEIAALPGPDHAVTLLERLAEHRGPVTR